MSHHHPDEVALTIRSPAPTPHEAEFLLRFMVLGLMLLAVMPGLLTLQSHEPEALITGPGESMEMSRPLFFACPVPAPAVRGTARITP